MKMRRTSLLARAFFLVRNEDSRGPVTLCDVIAGVFIVLPLACALFLIALPAVLIGMGAGWLRDRWRARRKGEAPQPSALMEWVRAKKRRICPLVEFEP